MFTTLARALVAGVLLAGSTAADKDHFILTQVRSLSCTRVDPLVTPNAIGSHVHHVFGASNFGPDSGSYDKLSQAKCSSTLIGDDKSSYWAPLVYYNHGNGSYSPMIGQTRIYYFLKALNGTIPVKPFPKGFRMLGGAPADSRPQTYPPRGQLSYEQQQAMDPRVSAIKFGCSAGAVQGEGNGGSMPGQRPYLPNDAPNGCGVLNAGLFYPSCNDGRLDSDDHFSHMAYPLDGPNGFKCPSTHNIKYPTIFIENFYFPKDNQPYRGPNQDNWVLSNGDTLGLTFHADYINGWQHDTLEQVLQQCNTPNAPEGDLQNCPPLARSLSVENANNCRSEGLIADEDVGLVAPINALPGCNPIWPVEARTKPSCKSSSNVGFVQPDSRYVVDEFKIALPLADQKADQKAKPQAKVAEAPATPENNAPPTPPTVSTSTSDNYGSPTSTPQAHSQMPTSPLPQSPVSAPESPAPASPVPESPVPASSVSASSVPASPVPTNPMAPNNLASSGSDPSTPDDQGYPIAQPAVSESAPSTPSATASSTASAPLASDPPEALSESKNTASRKSARCDRRMGLKSHKARRRHMGQNRLAK